MKENIVEFADRGAIEREAGEWLIRLDSENPLTDEEQAAIREWYARSPVHRQELKDLAAFWGKMNILTELSVPLEKTPAARGSTGLGQWFDLAGGARRAGALAAVLLVGITAGLGYWWAKDPLLDTNGLYTSVVGQQRTISLADGSVIQLNTDTRLRVAYDAEFRNISLLQGEAYFTVAKNRERPFRVRAGGGLVEAVGTAFSVYLKNSDISVSVTEGRVALATVKPAAESAPASPDRDDKRREDRPARYSVEESLGTLDAGKSAVIKIARSAPDLSGVTDRLAEPPTVELVHQLDKNRLQRQLSWRNGLLIFAGDPLQEVVDEISRYTTLRIEITDPEIKAIKIGGQFRVGDTDGMFDSLETNFGLRVIRLGDGHVQLATAD